MLNTNILLDSLPHCQHLCETYRKFWIRIYQPRPQSLLLDDFQNGGSSGESPGKGWVTWYKISENLGDFYHVTFWEDQNKMAAKVVFEIYHRTRKRYTRGSDGSLER